MDAAATVTLRDFPGHNILFSALQVKEQTVENLMRGRKVFEPPRFMSTQQAARQLLDIARRRRQEEVRGCECEIRGAPSWGKKRGWKKYHFFGTKFILSCNVPQFMRMVHFGMCRQKVKGMKEQSLLVSFLFFENQNIQISKYKKIVPLPGRFAILEG